MKVNHILTEEDKAERIKNEIDSFENLLCVYIYWKDTEKTRN